MIFKKIFVDYSATDCGRIFSHKSNKFLKEYQNKRGYKSVKISINGKAKTHLVHRLIAKAFLGESNLSVDHIDNNKTNNNIGNLQYIDAIENHRKAFVSGLIKKGTSHPFSKFSKEDISEIRNLKSPQSEIAKKYKTCQSVISRIKSKETYSDV